MNFLDLIDWLDTNQNLTMAHFDQSIKNFIEAPSLMEDTAISKFGTIPNFFVGRNTGIGETCVVYSKTIIGRYCSIAHIVQIGGMGHRMDHLSTGYLDETMPDKFTDAIASQYDKFTHIGCDVWIGGGAIILRDIKIDHGACVGAGSVVTKDVPPYAVVAGNPARIIKYRFPQKMIDELLTLKWWTLEPEIIKKLPCQNVEQSIDSLKRIRAGELSV